MRPATAAKYVKAVLKFYVLKYVLKSVLHVGATRDGGVSTTLSKHCVFGALSTFCFFFSPNDEWVTTTRSILTSFQCSAYQVPGTNDAGSDEGTVDAVLSTG